MALNFKILRSKKEEAVMIRAAYEEVLKQEWIDRNINNPNHELVVLRRIIPWEKITGRLSQFYSMIKQKEPRAKICE